ncbi:hypothetical protein PHYSODRAFT_468995, partial [Phytophthora sojae]
ETDVRERVVQFFRSSRQVTEEPGWSEFLLIKEERKLKGKSLIAFIEPQAYREGIVATLAYQAVRALFKIIVEKAWSTRESFGVSREAGHDPKWRTMRAPGWRRLDQKGELV